MRSSNNRSNDHPDAIPDAEQDTYRSVAPMPPISSQPRSVSRIDPSSDDKDFGVSDWHPSGDHHRHDRYQVSPGLSGAAVAVQDNSQLPANCAHAFGTRMFPSVVMTRAGSFLDGVSESGSEYDRVYWEHSSAYVIDATLFLDFEEMHFTVSVFANPQAVDDADEMPYLVSFQRLRGDRGRACHFFDAITRELRVGSAEHDVSLFPNLPRPASAPAEESGRDVLDQPSLLTAPRSVEPPPTVVDAVEPLVRPQPAQSELQAECVPELQALARLLVREDGPASACRCEDSVRLIVVALESVDSRVCYLGAALASLLGERAPPAVREEAKRAHRRASALPAEQHTAREAEIIRLAQPFVTHS